MSQAPSPAVAAADDNGNAALHFVDRHRAAGRADAPAFIDADTGGSLTYGALAGASDRMVGFYARHGIRREDRAALLMLDGLDWPVIFWGSLKAGVVPVALNTLLGTDVYDVILRDSRPRVLFVSAALLPVVRPLLPGHPFIDTVFVIGDGDTATTDGLPAGCLSFTAEHAAAAPGPAVVVTGDDCAFWLYSSGSTGRPKGVRHVHASLRATADSYGAGVLGIRADDVVYSAAKLFFAYGLGNAMTFPMAVGATTVLLAGRPTPDRVLAILARHKPTLFCGVPTLYGALVAAMDQAGVPAGLVLRRCISAGEALPARIGERWRALTGVDILDGVGSTEMLHIFLSNAPGDVVYGTAGTAVPGYDLRLVDEAGAAVTGDAIGELLVRGASAADGYWNQRAKSRATFEGEWTRTGDKYTRTAAGRYVYCGRTDDMFKVSGIWVSPFEVEQALIAHPAVLEAAVIARRDDDGLEKPKAFVVLAPGATADGLEAVLKQQVQQHIGKWKYPRWIDIVPDLPKTATGKIQRFKLRDGDG